MASAPAPRDARPRFSGFLCDDEEWDDDDELIARVRRSLGELGVVCSSGDAALNFEEGADWLPPLEAALDPATAEQGLLARAARHQDAKATGALEKMYTERGWANPFDGFSF